MSQTIYLTRAGYEKLISELEHLKNKERRKISKAIGEARLMGDISENAEYDAAKDAQAHCEARIAELEGKLSNVAIIEDQNIPGDKVFIGAFVSLEDIKSKEKVKYQLVAPEESDFENNKISVLSPIGKSLMGHKEGDAVDIEVPAGTLHYKIKKIQRPK